MMLNLMRVETLRYFVQRLLGVCCDVHCCYRVEDMMKHSFAEIDSARHRVDRQEALDSIKENILSLSKKEDCLICVQDIDSYFSACVSVAKYTYNMQVSVMH